MPYLRCEEVVEALMSSPVRGNEASGAGWVMDRCVESTNDRYFKQVMQTSS